LSSALFLVVVAVSSLVVALGSSPMSKLLSITFCSFSVVVVVVVVDSFALTRLVFVVVIV